MCFFSKPKPVVKLAASLPAELDVVLGPLLQDDGELFALLAARRRRQFLSRVVQRLAARHRRRRRRALLEIAFLVAGPNRLHRQSQPGRRQQHLQLVYGRQQKVQQLDGWRPGAGLSGALSRQPHRVEVAASQLRLAMRGALQEAGF